MKKDSIYKGIVRAVCTSPAKGTEKKPVEEGHFIAGFGIERDAHAGKWHRQVSLLSYDKVEDFNAKGAGVTDGAFGENLLVEGIDFKNLPVGTILRAGGVVLKMTQIGKECHESCAIRKRVGDCIMPREGVFAEVLEGGVIRAGDEMCAELPAEDRPFTAAVITVSDKGSRGERKDESGPAAAEMLKEAGYEITEMLILPDEPAQLKNAFIRLADRRQVDLIVTSGGTGFSLRDQTPEATLAVVERETRGIPEATANSIYDEILDFASYAFNKAHAVSYAIVVYRTAYMKRHYPQQYMAALLTSILDSSVKVAEYIAECRNMGIQLLPPDVNASGANFTVDGQNIRYGLVAIKGIGWGAIESLVAEREANGPFTDFEDFCRRMSGGELNRRAIENLIKAGAFDSMGCKRKALIQIAGAVMDSIAQSVRDNISGQLDLFGDFNDEGEKPPAVIPLPEVEEFTPMEKMAMEKETTGLYLSGHPMDSYRDAVRRIGAVPLGAVMADFAQEGGPQRFQDNQMITVAGVVESHRTRTTKNNALMSYIQLEDDTGSMELMAFQKALDSGGAYIKDNAALVVRGRISVRDEKDPQLMVESIRPISDLNAMGAKEPPAKDRKLWVKVKSADDPILEKIRLILTMFPGNQQMILYCEKEKKRIGASCLIHEALVDELTERLGKENVVVK